MIEKIKRWVFRKEIESQACFKGNIEVREFRLRTEREEFDREKLAFDLKKQSFKPDILSLTRELLKGFDSKLLNAGLYGPIEQVPDILDEVRKDGEEDSFLSQVRELKKNTAFQKICAFNVRNQILIIAKFAGSAEEGNFGRGSINGIDLVRSDIERLNTIYEQKHKPKAEYDKHKAI